MVARQPPKTSLLAAGVLALVTGSVFFLLQDYGPESAIRRFHHAILKEDAVELQQVTLQNIKTGSVRELIGRVRAGLKQGATYKVVRMDRRGRDVLAAVVYTLPNGLRMPMVWVVEKNGPSWKVNAEGTLNVFRDAMGF